MVEANHILPKPELNRKTEKRVQRLVNADKADDPSRTLVGIRRGLDQVTRREGRLIREFVEELAEKQGISFS